MRTAHAALASATIALLTACGGGGGSSSTATGAPSATAAPVAISRVIVAGDSLADVGTFGYKATVQNASNVAAGYPIYPELVARGAGAAAPCAYFRSGDKGNTFTTDSACTDFAVAGSSVVNPVTRGGDNQPFSLRKQLESAVTVNGAWKAGDLVVIDAGGNDVADLAEAYVGAQTGNAADQAVFLAFLGQQLSGSTINGALAQSDGGSVAAGLYMQQVARTFWSTVKANTLDKGATRVALLSLPDIGLTPRLRSLSGSLAGKGATAPADFLAAVRQWVVMFNTELARQAAGESRVVIAPYFADFDAQNASPSTYGLTNVSDAACPTSVDFPQCTDVSLDAAAPAGLVAGWWKTWLYSDRFHPTPKGHELLAASVMKALQGAGWM